MLAGAVPDSERANERRSIILQLVERRLHRDAQLHCGLRPLERGNADVLAKLCGCRGGIVERKHANVCLCHLRQRSNGG